MLVLSEVHYALHVFLLYLLLNSKGLDIQKTTDAFQSSISYKYGAPAVCMALGIQ